MAEFLSRKDKNCNYIGENMWMQLLVGVDENFAYMIGRHEF